MSYLFPLFYLSLVTSLLFILDLTLTRQLYILYVQQKDYVYYLTRIQNDTASAEDYYLFSLICIGKKELDNALLNLKIVIFRTKNQNTGLFLESLITLAQIYESLNYYTQATKFYDQALSLDEENIKILQKLAYLFEKNQNFTKSIQLYKKILSYESDNKFATKGVERVNRINNQSG